MMGASFFGVAMKALKLFLTTVLIMFGMGFIAWLCQTYANWVPGLIIVGLISFGIACGIHADRTPSE